MARDSKTKRKHRRTKRELNLAYRLLDLAIIDRDQWRGRATMLLKNQEDAVKSAAKPTIVATDTDYSAAAQ